MKREWLLSLCSKLKQTDRFRPFWAGPLCPMFIVFA